MNNKFIYIFIFIIAFNQSVYGAGPVSAGAATTPTSGAVSGMNQVAGATDKAKGMQGLLNSPAATIVLAGIASVYSGILMSAASKQEKESKENIKKIDKIIASYKDSVAAFCPKGRENLAEPSCYCYSSDGTKNTNRSNSQTCIDLWAKDSSSLNTDATNYALEVYNPDVAGCVAVDGQFDELCKCKKLLDSKGNNACQKGSSVSIPTEIFSTGLATSTGIKALTDFSANSANGNPRFDLMDSATLGTQAINARKFKDQMISKIPANSPDKAANVNEGNAEKYAKAILGEGNIAAKMQSNSGGSAMNVSSARSDNPAMNDLLKQAQAKAGIDLVGSGNGLGNKKEAKKSGFDLNFGNDSQSGGTSGQVVAGFPERNYKYKNSDIVTDDKASIFEIISNRYVQSGLKRLFEDEAAAPKK